MIKTISEVDRRKICEWAIDELWSDALDCKEALSYLRERRRLSDDVIQRFQIGYVPKDAWHDLSGRLIMPLKDQHNSLVCITTRDFREDAELPHWHESFDKKRYLYGIHLAKYSIVKHKKTLVVEGQFDTQALHDHGIKITVGVMGGVLTFKHACILRRYCKDVYIWFDPDKAGDRSKDRTLSWFREFMNWNPEAIGMNFIPVYNEDGLDPDDFVIDKGYKAVIDLLKKSRELAKGKKYAPTL
jgi:DNA primase